MSEVFPVTRRQFITTSGLAAASLQSGCFTLGHKCPPPYFMEKAPGAVYIDTHGHIFNGADIPIRGFMYQVLLGEHPDRPTWWLTLLKPLLNTVVALIQKNQDNWKVEDHFLDDLLAEQDKIEKEKNPTGDRFISRQILHDILEPKFKQDDEMVFKTLSKSIKEFGGAQKLLKPYTKKVAKLVQQPARAVGLDLTIRLSEEVSEIVKWLGRLAKFRVFNMYEWVRTYPSVDIFMPSFLDVEAWIKNDGMLKPDQRVSIEQQMILYGKIARLFRGRVLPMIGFDPMRSPGDDALKVVKTALTDHGFVGVKLYPPMGFRGFNNEEIPDSEFPSKHGTDVGKRIDAQLKGLYELCLEQDACVLAHCEDSMESSKGYKLRAHPLHWKQLIEGDDRYKNLRLNLGHFGGMSDLNNGLDETGTNGRGWAKLIARDMMQPDRKVYVDTGDFNGMKRLKDRELYHRQLKTLIDGNPDVENKLMYGSDWYMLAKEPGSTYYLHYWHQAQLRHFPDSMDKFFGHNALNWMGLSDPNSVAKKRLTAYFDRFGLTPDWG